MATKAEKLPSGQWRARAQDERGDGKQHYKSFTAPTRKEAEYLAAQFEVTQRDTRGSARGITLKAAMDVYIKDRMNVLSPTTIASYKKYQRNYYKKLENRYVGDITAQDAQRLINDSSAGRSPKTVREIYSFFCSVMRQYSDTFSPRVNLPPKVRHEMNIPTEDKIAEMYRLSRGTPLGTAILISALCGLRRGEICALTYADVDAEKNTITVNKSLAKAFDGAWVLKPPKSYAGTRTIAVDKSIIDSIMRDDATPADRVCPIAPDGITKSFIKLRNQIGADVRFHDLRHYNASIMLALGIPDKYAMERLGQSTPGVIKNVYQHIIDSKRQSVSDTMCSAAFAFIKKYDTKSDTGENK
ncbi:MAG: site-specific integrase [Ruthenibacterium sp.]